MGPFGRECRHWAGVGDEKEESGGEDAANGGLNVTKLNTIQIHYTKNVGGCKAIKTEDFEHLEGGDEGATALADYVGGW